MDRQTWIRVTAAAGVLGALAWAVKFTALAMQDGQDGVVDAVAFTVGLVLVPLGAVSLALRLTRRRTRLATAAAVVVALVLTVLLVPGLSIVSTALFGDTGAGREGGLAALALASLVVGVAGRRDPVGQAPAAVRT